MLTLSCARLQPLKTAKKADKGEEDPDDAVSLILTLLPKLFTDANACAPQDFKAKQKVRRGWRECPL